MTRSITVRPSAEDLIAVSRGSALQSMRKPRFWWIVLGTALFGMAVFAAVDYLSAGRVTSVMVAIGAAVAVGWLAVAVVVGQLVLPMRGRRAFRERRTLDRDFTFSWDESGYHQSSSGGTEHTAWSEYHDWFESRDIFAFGVGGQLYHFAPKRAMTAEQCADLRALAGTIRRP